MKDNKETCLQLKTGSCSGCEIIRIAREKFRYEQISPESAARAVQAAYCPSRGRLDRSLLRNKESMFAFGQSHSENTDFTGVPSTPKGRKRFVK